MKRKRCSDCGGSPAITEEPPFRGFCSICGKESIAWALKAEAWKQWNLDNQSHGLKRHKTGIVVTSKHNETKYHDTVDINDINFDVMPTCIYLYAGYGKTLRCGRQLL